MSHRNLYNRVRDAHRGSIVIRAQHKVLSQTNGTGAQVQLVVARLRALVQCLHHLSRPPRLRVLRRRRCPLDEHVYVSTLFRATRICV